MEINSETAENILSSYNREWSKFISTLRDNSIDRIFAGYEQPEIMEPTTFAFLLKNREITRSSNYHYHTGLYGYDYNRLPEDARKELLGISNIIKHIADQRNIPIYEGYYSIDSGFMDIDPDIYFFSRWEANFARILNFQGKRWQFQPKRFQLETQKYTPDFYLPASDEYIEINKQYNELNKKLNQLSKSIREILDNETDVNKRKEIIDFVYAGKVEEVHEHALRKMYLK